MATVGNTGTPSSGWAFYGLNVQNQVWTQFTMPAPGGYITNLHAYFDTNQNGSATCWLVLWDQPGNVLGSVTVAGIPNGTHAAGSQQWNTAALGSSVFVAGGTNINLGFAVPQHNGAVFSSETGGSSSSNALASPPGGFTGAASTGIGGLGAYADYTPLVAPVLSSAAPSHGAWGDSLTITGSNFLQVTSITLNGTTVSTFTINSDSQVTLTIPVGATTGNLTFTNAAGSGSLGVNVSLLFVFDGTNLRNIDALTSNGSAPSLATWLTFDGTNLRQVT